MGSPLLSPLAGVIRFIPTDSLTTPLPDSHCATAAGELAMCGIFVCVDVDENTETPAKLNIDAMPYFQFYKNGTLVGEVRGAFKEEVESKVEQLLMPM